jgi:hypothetical protein
MTCEYCLYTVLALIYGTVLMTLLVVLFRRR